MDRRRRSSVEPGFRGTRQPSRRAGARSATGRIEYAELSAVSFSNEGGVATGVQLPLRKRERRRAAPEMQERPRTVQGQTVVETGSGKPRAIAALQSAPVQYGPGPRISMQAGGNHQCAASNRPDTRQRLTRRLELDKEKTRVAGSIHARRVCLFDAAH